MVMGKNTEVAVTVGSSFGGEKTGALPESTYLSSELDKATSVVGVENLQMVLQMPCLKRVWHFYNPLVFIIWSL